MKWIFFLGLSSCATPVINQHWTRCEDICWPSTVKEACVSFFKGEGCTCYDDATFWLEDLD